MRLGGSVLVASPLQFRLFLVEDSLLSEVLHPGSRADAQVCALHLLARRLVALVTVDAAEECVSGLIADLPRVSVQWLLIISGHSNLLEVNKNCFCLQESCYKYWPDAGETVCFGNYSVSSLHEQLEEGFILHRMNLVFSFHNKFIGSKVRKSLG